MGTRILEWVGGLSSWVLVLASAGLAFAETAMFLDLVVPGEVGMVIVGAAAARSDYPLLPVVVAGMVGAVIGDSVSYAIGRRWGTRVVCRWEFTRRRFERRMARAERYFERHGGWLVFVARFVGAFRAVVPLVAGTAGMPYPRFLAWNVGASIAWAGIVVTLGYHFGDEIARLVDRVGLALSLVGIGAAVAWWLLRRRRSRPRSGGGGVGGFVPTRNHPPERKVSSAGVGALAVVGLLLGPQLALVGLLRHRRGG